jgi:transposase
LYQRERNGIVRVRVLVVTQLAEGATSVDIERSGVCVRSTVSYVAERFRCLGELGLEDGRRFNGGSKLSEAVLMGLAELIRYTPQRFGWRRTNWTRELLVRQLASDTGVRLSVTTLTRLLKKMGAR